MLAAIRSVLFILIMAITVTLYATATVLCFFLPVKVRYAIASSWPRLMLQVGRWLCGMRWKVIGTENLPEGPAIVLGKHQSTWETFFLQLSSSSESCCSSRSSGGPSACWT